MLNLPYEIPKEISPNDEAVLNARRAVIQSALMCEPIRWQVQLDSRERPHYLGIKFSTTSDVLIQFLIDDIQSLDDAAFKGKIIAGDFAQREIS